MDVHMHAVSGVSNMNVIIPGKSGYRHHQQYVPVCAMEITILICNFIVKQAPPVVIDKVCLVGVPI